MKAFVIAEAAEAQKDLCAGARTLADEVVLVSIGDAPQTGVADKAYHIALPEGELYENATDTVIALFDEVAPEIVLVETTPRLKIVGGRLAAHADTSVINDVAAFDGDAAESLYFGGLATMKRRPAGSVRIYSTNGSMFSEAEASGTDAVEEREFVPASNPLKLRGKREVVQEGADIGRAPIVVGAGRGFAKEEDLDLARSLAAAVRGEIACSRPIAENEKWLPKSLYIGVSGRVISPKVYFAVGISGQMQHMVGCNRAGTMFAINKDKNAPVFKQCDYGIVGDVKDVLPKLVAAL